MKKVPLTTGQLEGRFSQPVHADGAHIVFPTAPLLAAPSIYPLLAPGKVYYTWLKIAWYDY